MKTLHTLTPLYRYNGIGLLTLDDLQTRGEVQGACLDKWIEGNTVFGLWRARRGDGTLKIIKVIENEYQREAAMEKAARNPTKIDFIADSQIYHADDYNWWVYGAHIPEIWERRNDPAQVIALAERDISDLPPVEPECDHTAGFSLDGYCRVCDLYVEDQARNDDYEDEPDGPF